MSLITVHVWSLLPSYPYPTDLPFGSVVYEFLIDLWVAVADDRSAFRFDRLNHGFSA